MALYLSLLIRHSLYRIVFLEEGKEVLLILDSQASLQAGENLTGKKQENIEGSFTRWSIFACLGLKL